MYFNDYVSLPSTVITCTFATSDAILYDATVGPFWIKSTTELKYVAKFHFIMAFLGAIYVCNYVHG